MNWKESEILIRSKIIRGVSLDNRTVLDGPDYLCKGYDYNASPGYKIKIGEKTFLEIPFTMLIEVYKKAIANNGIYENKVFKLCFGRQCRNHPCHVHVIGRIFEKAGAAQKIDKRKYKLI
jgi:hypothetical protein